MGKMAARIVELPVIQMFIKMGKAIHKRNWLYTALSPLVQFGTRCHYNHFDVHGLENLPKDGPYIFAPCHQQCLMEPLVVLCFSPKAPVYLARADIFRQPAIRAILTFLRILPVYRIRDGQDSLGRNQGIFDSCRDALLDGYPVCIMAEGRHNNRHALLPLRKGMFRIAGETQLALGDRPLYIVPTGIDFDDYERPYSNVVVNIGKPIPVQPFMETYRDNEPVALNQMRDTLAEHLRPLMLDIRDEEHYEEIWTLCNVLNKEMRHREGLRNTAWNRFRMRQKISAEFGARNSELLEAATKAKFTEHWPLAATLLAWLAVLLPLAAAVVVPVVRWVLLFCLLCYPIPLIPTHLIMKRKVADPQFRSSFNWGVRFFLSILYAIVIGIVMAATGGAWMSRVADIGAWWGLVAVAWVHVGARLTAPVVNFLRNLLASSRYWLMRLTGKTSEADRIYRSILQMIDDKHDSKI